MVLIAPQNLLGQNTSDWTDLALSVREASGMHFLHSVWPQRRERLSPPLQAYRWVGAALDTNPLGNGPVVAGRVLTTQFIVPAPAAADPVPPLESECPS
jgi:hypothetical protein